MQPERDPRRTSPHLGLGSSFNTSGASSSSSTNPGGKIPPLMSQSVTYRPEKSRAIMDEDLERSIDLHISRAREEVRFLGKLAHQPVSQGSRFSSAQRDEFLSPGTGMTTYPLSSTSGPLGHRRTETESGSSSLDWLSDYKKSTAEDSSKFYSSASSVYASTSDGRFNSTNERERNMLSVPGLGDSDYPNKPVVTESSRPKYTSESAANILLHFGLEKEDLEHLISYPEDQITPANLPFILRQIRIQKTKRATTGVQSKTFSESPHTQSVSGMNSLSSSGMAGMWQKDMPSAVLQQSNVIDYGHTGKYTAGVGNEIGRASGSRPNSSGSGNTLPMDAYHSSHSQELKKTPTEVRSSALDSSRDQGGSITHIRPSYRAETGNGELSSVAPPSKDPTERLKDQQTKQSSQTIHSAFSLPKKDTDLRVHKSEASKNLLSNKLDADCRLSAKIPPCTLFRDVHPSRPGLVVIGSSNVSGTKDHIKNKSQESTSVEQKKTQQQQQQAQIPPLSQMGKMFWPPVFSAAKPMPVPPVSLNPTIPNASHAMARSVFIPNAPPIVIPTTPPQPISALFIRPPMQTMTPLPLSNRLPPVKVAVSKGLPTPVMMHDYAAATPRVFPHTCSLCNKECAHMKVSGRLHSVLSPFRRLWIVYSNV